jgi:hypothetical protein
MIFKKVMMLATLVLSVTQNTSIAACAEGKINFLLDTAFIDGADPSIAFKVGGLTPVTSIDTISQSGLLSDLKALCDGSTNVIIASICNTQQFGTVPDSQGRFVYAESVTVRIESVIKGTMIPQDRIFTSYLNGISGQVKSYDSLAGIHSETITLGLESNSGYRSIIGNRFLLFLSDSLKNCSNIGIMPRDPCSNMLNNFLIDKNDFVYYDGHDFDFEKMQVIRDPLLKVELVKVLQKLRTASVNKREMSKVITKSGTQGYKQPQAPTGTWAYLYVVSNDNSLTAITNTAIIDKLMNLESLVENAR